jgi:salicylate hydroxylase
MVQDASWANMRFYHLPDGPEQEERDRKLREFNGESDVSYDWLWQGTPLNDPDLESFHYPFVR